MIVEINEPEANNCFSIFTHSSSGVASPMI